MKDCCQKHLQKVLDKNPACCVLITCGPPSDDGQMQVEMTYYGDSTLASYLLRGAQCFVEEEEEEDEEHRVSNVSIHVFK